MDAPPSLNPSVGGGKDESSALTQAAQKVQLVERERDSFKAERHMYQTKWLAAEDMLEAVKAEKQSLEVLVQCNLLSPSTNLHSRNWEWGKAADEVEFNSIYIIYAEAWIAWINTHAYQYIACFPSIIASVRMHIAASIYRHNGIPSFKLQWACFIRTPVAMSDNLNYYDIN